MERGRIRLWSVTVVILVPTGYKVSQGANNKEHCYIVSFWARFFGACMQEPETPLERVEEYIEGTHDTRGRVCPGQGEGMAHMGTVEGKSLVLLGTGHLGE